jgi:hypothetical protein
MPTRAVQYHPQSDCYALLGVPPDASPGDVLRAYRAAVKRYHPDAGGDPTGERIRAVNGAYAVLRDPVLRHEYDCERRRRLHAGLPVRRRRRRRRTRRPGAAERLGLVAVIMAGAIVAFLCLAVVTARASGASPVPASPAKHAP